MRPYNHLRTLNIIGCGKVGKVLGYLFSKTHCYSIQNILNTSKESSYVAKEFIGEGSAITKYSELQPADSFMLTVPDDHILNVVSNLSALNCFKDDTIIFHCSGAQASTILQDLKIKNVQVASVHPIKSFSNPEYDILHFINTYCAIEGDALACDTLKQDFQAIGARILEIKTEHKLLHHCATVFCSNYFVTVVELSLQLFAQIGINKEDAIHILRPLVEGAWQQILKFGTTHALTGPIARGDSDIVANEIQALEGFDMDYMHAYKFLGKLTLELAKKKNNLSESKILELEQLLQ